MSRTLRRIFTTSCAALAALAGLAAPAGAGQTWTTYHADSARSGADLSEASLDPASAAWSTGLGAAVYGQPVVADGRVFAATEGDEVAALDPHDGHVLWSQSIGTPVADIVAITGCGDIAPLGITSTPVVDTATHTVYAVGEISDGGHSVHHQLVGFDTYTGAETLSEPVDPPLPAGESSAFLLQRAALALGNGRVYVSYGGNDGDCGVYQGWVVGVAESGPANMVSFDVAGPGGQGGAVWEAGSGPAIGSDGSVYIATGNPNGSTNPPYAESVVKLSPALTPLASFKDTHATGDLDLATNNPVLLPDGTLFAVGKTDIGYVLRQSDLALVATIPGVCGSNPDGGPAYDASTGILYVPCAGGGIQPVDVVHRSLRPRLGGANSAPILVGTHLWAVQSHTTTVSEYDATTASTSPTQTLSTPAPTPTFASPSAALGLLLVGTTSGVAAFDGPSGLPAPAPPAPVPPACLVPQPAGSYLMAAVDGGVFTFGGAAFCGSLGAAPLAAPVVGVAADPAGGYWLVGRDGGIFSFGAPFRGSAGGLHLNQPIVGMAATPDGGGYWLVASDGGIFAFGDAAFHGSTGSLHLNQPIVGMAATPDGGGYWLVASDGGIFAFGDAAFHGSTGSLHLNQPIVGMAATPGGGYWLVGRDGGIFAFGDAAFHGSTGSLHLNQPIVSMAATPDGGGYRLVASDGGLFSFGDAAFAGSLGGLRLNQPIVGIAGAA